MAPPTRLTIPACIGCGAMRQDGSCPAGCAERRAELVSGGDYDCLVAAAAAAQARIRGLRAVAGELIGTQPPPGEWQAAYQALQRSARAALRRFRPPPGSPDNPLLPARTVVVWRCPDCGGADAPQPCIGVCIWRPAQWVDAAAYKAERSGALADRETERSLAGLLHRIAFTTPRPGQFERSWHAFRSQARRALAAA